VNFHFDGFLSALDSATDVLSREVLVVRGIAVPARVYSHTANSEIEAIDANDPLLPYLEFGPWYEMFSVFRNTSTHESVISTRFSIDVQVKGTVTSQRIVFPLPDDPRSDTPAFKKYPDVVKYCEQTFKRAVSHTNQIYGHLYARSVASGSLPI
jgi:hypothetical protein